MRGLSATSGLRSESSPRLSGRHWQKLKVKPGCFASRLAEIPWFCVSRLKLTNWYCTSASSEPGRTRAKRLASEAPIAIWPRRRTAQSGQRLARDQRLNQEEEKRSGQDGEHEQRAPCPPQPALRNDGISHAGDPPCTPCDVTGNGRA